MNELSPRLLRFVAWASGVLIVILVGIIGLVVWAAATDRSVSHNQLNERLMLIEDRVLYLSCLSLVPIDERTPEAIASCQAAG